MSMYRNIFLKDTAELIPYRSGKRVINAGELPQRDRRSHGEWLIRQFNIARTESKSYTPSMVAAIKAKQGMYVEFTGREGFDLVTKGLENIRSHIRLLNVRSEENSATIYIPEGKESLVIKKISSYVEENTKNGDPKNNALIASIEQIKAATIEAFWIGDKTEIPKEIAVWCEVWLRTEDNNDIAVRNAFFSLCDELKIEHKNEYIEFPERNVVLAKVNYQNLQDIIGVSDSLAELRIAPESATSFINMPPQEDGDWVEDLKTRLTIRDSNSAVCILDTGIAFAHPLLEQSISETDAQAVVPTWGVADHEGHGTGMAGIALYNDLQKALESANKVLLTHSLESVKILPPKGANQEELYGAITQQGTLLAEIDHPGRNRVFCMAITADDKAKDGRPSSWSGAIDSLASGAEDGTHRLMLVSAGNIESSNLQSLGYPTANTLFSVENPGQAWNAITIGAYANIVQTKIPNYHAVADVGDLSPHSTTSLLWQSKWPIKPDILCAGGNMATDGTFYTDCDDLSLLTLNRDFVHHAFETSRATSAATAQAAWMAAKIQAQYPDLWPETIRALLIHSAQWTDKMVTMFNRDGKKTTGLRQLFRMCGYGIPNLKKALHCVDNSVNMIIQGELQPYQKLPDRCAMNEMHLHSVPWPCDLLQELGDTPVTMRITLSYFIEPGPGEVGWKDKYRYPSCGLRFDVNKPGELKGEFIRRVNVAMRDEEDGSDSSNDGGSNRWILGKGLRDVGSIHSDSWTGTAADLCQSHYIAVYPTIGWWRQRANLKMYSKHVRYALVVSISTPSSDIDLYTPIVTQIKIPIEIYSE